MAVLTEAERQQLRADFAERLSRDREPLGLTKSEVKAAINAADDWANANSASYNSALPLPARSVLTARQKAEILMFIIRRRFEVT